MKYFPHLSRFDSKQAATMNATLVTGLEMDEKPAITIASKNRT